MRDHLTTLGAVLRSFLERGLPALGSQWWEDGVLAKLSYQQHAAADERGWPGVLAVGRCEVRHGDPANNNWFSIADFIAKTAKG